MMNRQKMYNWMAEFTGVVKVPQTSRQIMDIFKTNVYTSDRDVDLLLRQADTERKELRHKTFIKVARMSGRIVCAGAHLANHVVLETKEAMLHTGDKVMDFVERVTLPLMEWREAADTPNHEIANRSMTEE